MDVVGFARSRRRNPLHSGREGHFPSAVCQSRKLEARCCQANTPSRSCKPCGRFSVICSMICKNHQLLPGPNPGTQIKKIVGLGSTFRIAGLRKFLGAQLGLDIVRMDEFQRISVGGREAASFAEHTVTGNRVRVGLARRRSRFGRSQLGPFDHSHTNVGGQDQVVCGGWSLDRLGADLKRSWPDRRARSIQGETALSQARSAPPRQPHCSLSLMQQTMLNPVRPPTTFVASLRTVTFGTGWFVMSTVLWILPIRNVNCCGLQAMTRQLNPGKTACSSPSHVWCVLR